MDTFLAFSAVCIIIFTVIVIKMDLNQTVLKVSIFLLVVDIVVSIFANMGPGTPFLRFFLWYDLVALFYHLGKKLPTEKVLRKLPFLSVLSKLKKVMEE